MGPVAKQCLQRPLASDTSGSLPCGQAVCILLAIFEMLCNFFLASQFSLPEHL